MEAALRSSASGIAPSFVGLYAWAASVSFGLVVADIAYAGVLRSALDAGTASGIFSRVSDALLWTSALTMLAALGALAAAWAARTTRYLILASIALASGLVLTPALLPAGLLESGAPVRLAGTGAISVLAVLALAKLERAA